LAGLAATGCFYTDVINQRPSLDIEQLEPLSVYRGGTIKVQPVANDPDGHDVFFHWRAYACTDQTDCDQAPFFEFSDRDATIDVPDGRAYLPPGLPLRLVRVVLEGVDAYGATAKPAQELWIPLADHSPLIEIVTASSYGQVVSAPITIIARVRDADKADKPTVSWQVFSPSSQPAYDFVDKVVMQDPMNPDLIAYGKTLTAYGEGDFEIVVSADDGFGLPESTAMMPKTINVRADRPPCLRQLTPLVAAAPSALPMFEPTVFQVHVVEDDLDPYPTVNDATLGPTRFTWSLLAPGSPRQVLSGVTGNSVALDPASYQPGDIVELRVDIADRVARATCPDADATCSVSTDITCFQRQTWRVEVR
jgi:hypothetical protein